MEQILSHYQTVCSLRAEAMLTWLFSVQDTASWQPGFNKYLMHRYMWAEREPDLFHRAKLWNQMPTSKCDGPEVLSAPVQLVLMVNYSSNLCTLFLLPLSLVLSYSSALPLCHWAQNHLLFGAFPEKYHPWPLSCSDLWCSFQLTSQSGDLGYNVTILCDCNFPFLPETHNIKGARDHRRWLVCCLQCIG
jgi:hypothetical protein